MHGWLNDFVVPLGMFVLMLGMGLSLATSDFRRIWLTPRAGLVGSAVQLVAMPLVGVALALAFALPPMHAAGLVAIAACPGGTLSNVFVYVGRADVPLSVTLTATATLATLVTLPLWLRALLGAVGNDAVGLDVPVLETALRLAAFTVAPIALGMALRRRRPAWVAWERRVSGAGAALMVGALVLASLYEGGTTTESPGASLVPVIVLHAAAVTLGYVLPLALGLSYAQSATIGVETCLKNGVLGLFVVSRSLPVDAALPVVFYMALQLPVSAAILASSRLLERRAVARADP